MKDKPRCAVCGAMDKPLAQCYLGMQDAPVDPNDYALEKSGSIARFGPVCAECRERKEAQEKADAPG